MAHNIVELRDRFKRLLDNLCERYNFAEYIENEPEDLWNDWEEYDDAANDCDIWVSTGCTKFVIGDGNNDYIIKFQPPCVANEGYDYCGREVEIYKAAMEKGFEDKFAWTDFLFDYHFNDSICVPVYVMEWCQCSYDMIDDEMDDWHYTRFCSSNGITKGDDEAYERYTDSRDNCDVSYSERMLEWAFDCWGGEYSSSSDFVIFMRNMFINDIHAGNWGWCNNRLVLVDYSGYGENYDERSINY